MRRTGLISRIAGRVASWLRPARWRDRVGLDLPFCSVTLERHSDVDLAHEVTVVIPRVEVRSRKGPEGAAELEVVLSSITIAHSPRPPAAHERPPGDARC